MKNFLSLVFFAILFLGLGMMAWIALPDGLTFERESVPANVQVAGSDNKNWVALPLENAALAMASELKAKIETTAGVTVNAVQEWDSASQSYTSFEGAPGDDFALQTGGVYRVIVQGGGADIVWRLVGDVPDPAAFSYLLQETNGSDFNWIMLPLNLGSLTLASELAAHIEANASGAVTVDAIQSWNATAQSYHSYSAVPFPTGDFTLQIGTPYRVSVSSVQDGAVTWPE